MLNLVVCSALDEGRPRAYASENGCSYTCRTEFEILRGGLMAEEDCGGLATVVKMIMSIVITT